MNSFMNLQGTKYDAEYFFKMQVVDMLWVNLNCKTDYFTWSERDRNLCHFAFQDSGQGLVESINIFRCNENGLFVFKIFIPTLYYCKQRSLTEMKTRCHLLSLVFPIDLSLVFIFINDSKKTSKNQKKTFACGLQHGCSEQI